MSFATMKKNRVKDLDSLAKQATEAYEGKKNYKNDEFWKLGYDKKTGNGQAVIRFLPAKGPDAKFWIQYWDYFFKNPKNGQYYVEKALSTLGQPDPVGEYSSELWNTGEAGQKRVRDLGMTRNLNYVTNILVIDHPSNPEDNGKVFKYKFGKKIFGKIKDAMSPEFDGDEPINPFDFWDGANFKLRRKKVEGWANYDSSTFDKVSPLLAGDEGELERVYNEMENIEDLISADKFKSYDELKTKFNRVMGISAGAATSYSDNERTAEPRSDQTAEEESTDETTVENEASEESLSYFQDMANED